MGEKRKKVNRKDLSFSKLYEANKIKRNFIKELLQNKATRQ